MSVISIILVVIVAFLAGMEGILDEFQFHQPLVACTLIGMATGHLTACIILGGSLQMIALGWANIGAAVAPDAALASVASAIILVLGGDFTQKGISAAIAIAVPLAVAGLFLTMVVRTLAVPMIHIMDKAATEGNMRKIEVWHIIAVCMQGVRIAIPSAMLLAIDPKVVSDMLNAMPEWLTTGMTIGGGMVVAVGYAMVINMMATKEVWPFFIIGFAIAAVTQLTLIAIGALGISIALIYLNLSEMGGKGNGGGGSNSGDPLGDILNDY